MNDKFEKLTYSGKKCNNYLYFSFDAEYFNTDKITEELNIQPTSVTLKKTPVPKSTSWKYRINAGNKIDLETYLEKLVELFEPKIKIINSLKKQCHLTTRIQLVVDIDISPNSSTPYFRLNKRVINFLYKTETEIDFDLYKVDTNGILEK